MFTINGKYNNAIIYTDNVDNETQSQIIQLLNQEFIKENQIRIMPDCLPDFTEVLTIDGFKSIKDITKNDFIANFDNQTNEIVFRQPKSIINRPLRENEKMFEFYSKRNNFSFYATENHRVLTKNGVVLAKDIPDTTVLSDYVFFANKISENSTTKYSDLEIQLICWLVGDGCISNNGNGTIRVKFGFKKERKFNRIKYLLDEYKINYTSKKEKRGDLSILIDSEHSKMLISLLENGKKEFPFDFIFLNSHQFNILKEEIIQIDGDYLNYINKRGYRYYSVNKNNIDILQIAFCMNNHLASVKVKEVKNHQNLYYINVIESQNLVYSKSGLHNSKIFKTEMDSYNKNVYCIECDTSFFLIRQKGLTMITGNCHAGAGCVIGTTITLTDKVVPNLVGVDLGCGMLSVKLEETEIDLDMLDNVIRKYVPSGFDIHERAIAKSNIDKIKAPIDVDKAFKSLGTLGGGNHFIEVDKDKNGNLWLVVHTGSRHLGLEVCKHYQDLAYHTIKNNGIEKKIKETVEKLKSEGKHSDIENTIKIIKMQTGPIPKDLCYVDGQNFDDYIHDMELAQEHAKINRETIIAQILKYANLHDVERFDTIHNYIDIDNMILRKGAISAQLGEKVLIPMNMRDGSLICVGKGNPEWNYSAPHGAGRIMSRSQAKDLVSMEEYQKSMNGIYTTCVSTATIDESPMVYKPMDEIVENVKDTVDIIDCIKPIYNFKAN